MFNFHVMTEIEQILAQSEATESFKADVRRFMARGASRTIQAPPYAPTVKVMRLLAQLLANEPELPVERVRIQGTAGCSDFVGVVEVEYEDTSRRFEFIWDCRWRAQQEGWTDYFGFPDQIRAASEFGWQCFRVWRELEPVAEAVEEEGVGAS